MPRILRRGPTIRGLLFVTVVFTGVVSYSPVVPAAAGARQQSHVAPRIVIDTDLSLWWDDATAIGMANVLEQQGVLRILGILSDIRNHVAVPAIDAMDSAYGHPNIPLGAVAHTNANTAPHGYSDELVKELPHSIHSSDKIPRGRPPAPDAVGTPTRSQRHHRCHRGLHQLGWTLGVEARTGQLTRWPCTGSQEGHASGYRRWPLPRWGSSSDKPEAGYLLGARGGERHDWPTPIAWVDGSTGIQTKVGGGLCTIVPPKNPMRIVYESRFGCGPPCDGDWDGPTLLYAVGGVQHLFSELGQGGAASINPQGGLTWSTDPARPHDVYVHVADQQALNRRIDTLIAGR